VGGAGLPDPSLAALLEPEVLYHVRDVHRDPVDPRVLERLPEEPSRRTDERAPLAILLVPGLLSHEHECGAAAPLPEDRLRRVAEQLTRCNRRSAAGDVASAAWISAVAVSPSWALERRWDPALHRLPSLVGCYDRAMPAGREEQDADGREDGMKLERTSAGLAPAGWFVDRCRRLGPCALPRYPSTRIPPRRRFLVNGSGSADPGPGSHQRPTRWPGGPRGGAPCPTEGRPTETIRRSWQAQRTYARHDSGEGYGEGERAHRTAIAAQTLVPRRSATAGSRRTKGPSDPQDALSGGRPDARRRAASRRPGQHPAGARGPSRGSRDERFAPLDR
jgi:hypothetical protein